MTISDILKIDGQATAKCFARKFGQENVHWCPCDVTKEDQFTKLWDSTEEFFKGPVDVLVNNAGVNHLVGWRKCIEIDVVSYLFDLLT